jgi:transcriptional regulator GlxA family with amidase domain
LPSELLIPLTRLPELQHGQILVANAEFLVPMASPPTPDSPPQRISIAIVWLRKHFHESFRVDDLARRAGMSGSTFRQWFRTITGMSPLQYQKQLRLQEARSILRNERKDVATVSRRVGYESCSQFSREYSRLFGNPPVREVSKRMNDLL